MAKKLTEEMMDTIGTFIWSYGFDQEGLMVSLFMYMDSENRVNFTSRIGSNDFKDGYLEDESNVQDFMFEILKGRNPAELLHNRVK